LQEQHRAFFPSGRPITEAAGAALAQWAAGGGAKAPVEMQSVPAAVEAPEQAATPIGAPAGETHAEKIARIKAEFAAKRPPTRDPDATMKEAEPRW
jgi:hypothetical protein